MTKSPNDKKWKQLILKLPPFTRAVNVENSKLGCQFHLKLGQFLDWKFTANGLELDWFNEVSHFFFSKYLPIALAFIWTIVWDVNSFRMITWMNYEDFFYWHINISDWWIFIISDWWQSERVFNMDSRWFCGTNVTVLVTRLVQSVWSQTRFIKYTV